MRRYDQSGGWTEKIPTLVLFGFFLLGKVITQKGLAILGQSFSLTDVVKLAVSFRKLF